MLLGQTLPNLGIQSNHNKLNVGTRMLVEICRAFKHEFNRDRTYKSHDKFWQHFRMTS